MEITAPAIDLPALRTVLSTSALPGNDNKVSESEGLDPAVTVNV
jgi:hypothetical protein